MTEPWFVIHLRSGKDVLAHGDAQRHRMMTRKTPKALSWSLAKIHECSICHRQGPWTDDWSWWGSWKDIDEERPILKFCTRDCRLVHSGKRPSQPDGLPWQERLNLQQWEPMPQDERSAKYRSVSDRRRENGSHRRFEMPEHQKLVLNKGEGQCRWCGERITGRYAHQRSWHRRDRGDARDCMTEWLLHTDAEAQYWHLIARDGPGCTDCGRGDGKWVGHSYPGGSVSWIRWSVKLEVDHETPLYLKPLLDDIEERRALHHPVNLKLRCVPCHQHKSAREAADRARRR